MRTSFRILAASLLTGLLPTFAHAAVYYYPTYQTYGGISRAEFVRLAMERTGTLSYDGTNCFTDVRNQSYATYVCAAKQRGIINGYGDGSFHPDQTIAFIEAAAIAIRSQNLNVGYGGGYSWYTPYLDKLVDLDAIPTSIRNILEPISLAQAQELMDAVLDGRSSNNTTTSSSSDNHDDNDNDDVDLRIDVSDSSPEAGDRITFRIRVKNVENDDLENVDITVELDNDMDYISSSDSGDLDGDEVQWDNIDIDEDETVTLLLTVRIDSHADDGDRLRLRVEAEDSSVSRTIRVDDDNNNNNNDGDLKLSITDSDDPVEPGDTVTYRIRLENDDNDDIYVDVRAELDDDMIFVSASDDGDDDDDVVEWDNIRVREDETETITLTVRIRSSADDGDRVVLRVEANDEEDSETTEIDDHGNSSSNDDIDVSISDSDDPVQEGDIVTYYIELENRENDDVYVDVRAFLDDAMTFYSASNGGDEDGDDEVVWDDILIREDETRTLILTVRINSRADDGDTLRLRVEAGDGEDTETTRVEN